MHIYVPSAEECVWIAGPILGVLLVRWAWLSLDQIIAWLFPNWEFEQRLGWLNLRAQKRAATFLRWLTHLLHALLAVALYGILWAAEGLGTMTPSDPLTVASGLSRLPVLLFSLGFWVVYLRFELIPRLRHEYEEEELQRYRAEHPEIEAETERVQPRVPALEQDYRRLARRRR